MISKPLCSCLVTSDRLGLLWRVSAWWGHVLGCLLMMHHIMCATCYVGGYKSKICWLGYLSSSVLDKYCSTDPSTHSYTGILTCSVHEMFLSNVTSWNLVLSLKHVMFGISGIMSFFLLECSLSSFSHDKVVHCTVARCQCQCLGRLAMDLFCCFASYKKNVFTYSLRIVIRQIYRIKLFTTI